MFCLSKVENHEKVQVSLPPCRGLNLRSPEYEAVLVTVELQTLFIAVESNLSSPQM